MYKIDEIKMLRLGQRDENLARSLPFDCSDWLEQYPEASIHILFRRPGESAIVPMSTTLEGTTLTWLIHDFEVGKTGVGNAEFRAVDTAGLRRKSRIIPCSIEETLLGDDETVLYTQDQVDETLAHISEAAQAAQAAQASEEAAALSAQEAGEYATSASAAASVATSARDAAQAAKIAAETAQHQAEAAQSGVHADAEAAAQAKVAAQAAQANAQGAASQASADRVAAETARSDAEAAATHAEAVVEGIDQAGADQVAAVNAAGQVQVTAVNQAGTTQVGNVNTAGTTQVNAVQAKGTQVIASIPADYSALTSEVTGLKSATDEIIDVAFEPQALPVDAASEGWRLLDTGLCTSDSSAKLVKYKVNAGQIYKIVSDDKAQFQTVASVPSSGSPNRVGVIYGVGTFYAVAPSTATYLIISTSKTGSTAFANQMVSVVPTNFFTPYELNWTDGKAYTRYGGLVSVSGYSSTAFDVSAFRGETVSGMVGLSPDGYAIGFLDDYNILIASYINSTAGTYKYSYSVDVPSNAATMFLSHRNASVDLFVAPRFTYNGVFRKFENAYKNVNRLNDIENLVEFEMNQPSLRNGSVGNGANANMVTTQYVIPINHHYRFMRVDFILDETLADVYAFAGCVFKGSTDGMTTTEAVADSSVTKTQFNNNVDVVQAEPYKYFDLSEWDGYDHFSLSAWRSKNGTAVPIRIATDQRSIRISYYSTLAEYEADAAFELKNARHIKGLSSSPLTLLHFSDLHKDTKALARIMSDARRMGPNIDDAICTGDMVSNTYSEIESWWDASVLTCIGNHDTASYTSGSGYNWTALSMADRDTYYIAPFESGWGITHTSGTSYYYKDYATSKIRLIVMDAMLYSGTPGAEAAAQTAWLDTLLADAIANNLHVLIAIHAPHGGATTEVCSFSRYGQTIMPSQADCNTPQMVIDAVATAINNGLHFIGYLVGHTHQDNIWDAEGDGKQLMYCVTCAIVSQEAQWKNSDQYRGIDADAYNLVTIDTANTLIKIVRGGGANIDDHMRTRKAICFNYSTGEMVGEVL